MSVRPVDGFLLIDKPQAWTSHDVVAKVRGVTGQRKVGHAGTLDPMATGLLVLGVGRATRLLRFVQAGIKEYVARVMFGVATESLDADGAVLSREPMPFDADDLTRVMERFVGTVFQEPPMVSARKVEGRRLYELAREGEIVAREARPVEIHTLDLEEFAPSDYPEAVLRVRCSTGTYVRTLADDIARALGGRAHLIGLRRTRNGSLNVDSAIDIEIFTSEESIDWRPLLISPADGLADLPIEEVSADTAAAVANGVPITGRALQSEAPGLLRVVDGTGRLLAVYRSDGSEARAEVVLS
jgi:tRNA pseudouridine55 synthase